MWEDLLFSRLLLFVAFLLPLPAIGQGEASSSIFSRKFRVWVNCGMNISLTGVQLKRNLKTQGYGDDSFSSVIGISTSKEYPTSSIVPLAIGIGIERKWGSHNWLGLSTGVGPFVEATGFSRTGRDVNLFFSTTTGMAVEMKYRSWYISPQFARDVPESNFGFFLGPKIDFQTVKTEWINSPESAEIRRNTLGFGAIFGLRIDLSGKFKAISAFHWSPKVKFPGSEAVLPQSGGPILFSLPDISVGTGFFNLGLAYWF